MTKMTVETCVDFLQGKCFRMTCRFTHMKGGSKERIPCIDFERGRCSRGPRMCKYKHVLGDERDLIRDRPPRSWGSDRSWGGDRAGSHFGVDRRGGGYGQGPPPDRFDPYARAPPPPTHGPPPGHHGPPPRNDNRWGPPPSSFPRGPPSHPQSNSFSPPSGGFGGPPGPPARSRQDEELISRLRGDLQKYKDVFGDANPVELIDRLTKKLKFAENCGRVCRCGSFQPYYDTY